MIYGVLIEETDDAYTIDVVNGYGDARDFGISGIATFPKAESTIRVDRVLAAAGKPRVWITTTREALEQAARTCAPF